jgi:hypothetical protein
MRDLAPCRNHECRRVALTAQPIQARPPAGARITSLERSTHRFGPPVGKFEK